MTRTEYNVVEAAMKGMLDGYLASLWQMVEGPQAEAAAEEATKPSGPSEAPQAEEGPYGETPPDFSELPPTQGLAMRLRYYHPTWTAAQVAQKVVSEIIGAKTSDKTVNTFVRNYKQNERLWKFLRPRERPAG